MRINVVISKANYKIITTECISNISNKLVEGEMEKYIFLNIWWILKQEKKNQRKNRTSKKNRNILDPAILIITLNANELNIPIKRQRFPSLIQKQIPKYIVLKRHSSWIKEYRKVESKNMEKYHANDNQKKTGIVVILIIESKIGSTVLQDTKRDILLNGQFNRKI